jgi:hypothetical protein
MPRRLPWACGFEGAGNLNEIRFAAAGAYALGNARFQIEIATMTGRGVTRIRVPRFPSFGDSFSTQS